MFNSFIASAPGKVILSGEHSVVHGTHAIATVVDRRSFADFTTTSNSPRHDEYVAGIAQSIPTTDISLSIKYDGYVLIHQWSIADMKMHHEKLYLQCMAEIDDYDNVGSKYFTTIDKLYTYIQEHTHPSKHLHCKHHNTLDKLVDIFDTLYEKLPVRVMRYEIKSDANITEVDSTTLHPNIEVCPAKVFVLYYLFVLLSSRSFENNAQYPTVHTFLHSEIPMGSGLGSSASVCSSMATGFYNILRQVEQHDHDLGHKKLTFTLTLGQRKVINHWAFQGERLIHGTPSGVDNSCVVYGGVVTFRRIGTEVDLNFLPSGCLPQSMQIIITNTKQPKNTKLLVAGVRALKEKYPMVVEPLFHSIEQITQTIVKTIQQYLLTTKLSTTNDNDELDEDAPHGSDQVFDKDVYAMFHDVLFINQNILNALGVGHPKIDEVVNIGRAYGDNLITKLTGAGGGGCVISLVHPNAEKSIVDGFTQDCEQNGMEVIVTTMGQGGVMLHEKP